MPLLENIRKSISDISKEDALCIIISVRQSRRTCKKPIVEKKKAVEKKPMTQAELLAVIETLKNMEAENHA